MNASLMSLEIAVVLLGLGFLLLDLWIAPEHKRKLGYVAALAVAGIFAWSLLRLHSLNVREAQLAFNKSYVLDGLALFFKRFFLLAAVLVLIMAVEFADRIEAGISEYYSLILFALAGMMFAASANDFTMLFVSLELITVTFYVLTSFQRSRVQSLEAGVKYLIIGGLSTGFTVFGIALVYGIGHDDHCEPAVERNELRRPRAVVKYVAEHNASFPPCCSLVCCSSWRDSASRSPRCRFKSGRRTFIKARRRRRPRFSPSVPRPPVSFLLLRVLFTAVPDVTAHWEKFLIVISAAHDSLRQSLRHSAAQPQTAARLFQHCPRGLSADGRGGVERAPARRPFSIISAAICSPSSPRSRSSRSWRARPRREDITTLAGLNQRSPLLAAAMTAGDGFAGGHSAAGGFLRKISAAQSRSSSKAPHFQGLLLARGHRDRRRGDFALLLLRRGARDLLVEGNAGCVIHQRAVPTKLALLVCMAGILFIGIYPQPLLKAANRATRTAQ